MTDINDFGQRSFVTHTTGLKGDIMNITFENITLEEALKIIEFASQPKKDELEKAAKKCAKTGSRFDLQEYLRLRRTND